jgi:hypothetical protein
MKRRQIVVLTLSAVTLVGCDSSATAPNTPQITAEPSFASASEFQNSGFAVGEVTPRGAWSYDWNNTVQQWGRLHVFQPHRRLNDIACSDQPPPANCGGFTGRSGQRRAFVHIYVAEERSLSGVRPIFLLAWGDDDRFEAVVLSDTPGNRDVFRRHLDGDVEALIASVQTLAQTAGDVVRGRTRISNYYGDVRGAAALLPHDR